MDTITLQWEPAASVKAGGLRTCNVYTDGTVT